ncbi:MAG TPA: hypothetical protein VIL46_05705, partial [Gemmataceae bacterium]
MTSNKEQMTNEQPAMHLKATLALGIVAASLSGTAAPAQVKLPPPPERYDVELRFRIDAGRNERIRQFLAMLEYFGSIGFEVARGTDTELMMFDPTAERLRGTIGSDRARLLLREPHVRTVLLTPAGYAPPADPSERVKVAVELERGLAGPAQQRLYVQALGRLARMGFDPAVAYDHRGYTLLRGTVPAGVLPSLLKDLRGLPTGWLLPETPYAETPEPLRNVVAVRVVEVLPEPPGAPPVVPRPDPLPPVPPDQPHLFKLDAGLRRLLAAAKGQPQALRVEVHYDRAVNMEAVGWRLRLEELSYLLKIEGVIGRTATVSVPGVELAAAIASFPEVLWVRLPHSGAPVAVPPAPRPAEEFDVLAATRVADLHRLGFRGGGVRLALIDSDFSGYAALVGKGLPERTRLIDLTTLLTPALEPYPSGGGIGHGTHCALAAALAAPSAELLLVRVDPTAPHLLETIARAARGDYSRPESVRVRTNELREEREALGRLRTAVTEEYRQAFDDFSDTPEAQQRREAARKAVEDLKRREQEHDRRSRVLARVEAALAGLD